MKLPFASSSLSSDPCAFPPAFWVHVRLQVLYNYVYFLFLRFEDSMLQRRLGDPKIRMLDLSFKSTSQVGALCAPIKKYWLKVIMGKYYPLLCSRQYCIEEVHIAFFRSSLIFYANRYSWWIGLHWLLVLVEKKDKISDEWIIQLYFSSLWSESKVQKVVELPHATVVYKV